MSHLFHNYHLADKGPPRTTHMEGGLCVKKVMSEVEIIRGEVYQGIMVNKFRLVWGWI